MITELFIQNKYTTLYLKLIEKSKTQEATDEKIEKHHIIPRSLGGSDDPSNLAFLTLRQHYIAHLLLVKCVNSSRWQKKMAHALCLMSGREVNFNSRLYEKLKTKYLYSMDEKYNYYYNSSTDEIVLVFESEIPPEGFEQGSRPFSEEHKQKMRKPKPEGHKVGSKTKGMRHYTNDITGETIFVDPKDAPVGEGWRNGTKAKGTKKKSYSIWHNRDGSEQKYVMEDDIPPEGWIKGRISSEKQLASSRKGCAAMAERTDNKNRTAYYDPITLTEIKIRSTDIPPEGWIKGRSPDNIRTGHIQSDYQKQRVKEGKQKTYKIVYLDGREETVKGLGDWLRNKKVSRPTFDYHRKHKQLWKYGIESVTNIA